MLQNKARAHDAALLCALFVGLLHVGPYLFFMLSIGDAYQGIPLLSSANEVSYLGRIREVVDGHGLIGSFSYYEYKDEWPISPPLGEMLYALPSVLLGIPLVATLIASKFVLPFILFLLAYALIFRLIEPSTPPLPSPSQEGGRTERDVVLRKLTAIAGALLVVLGYDLVDYRSILNFFFSGAPLGGTFLLWARPVNPIMGALFLFSFLLSVWALAQKTKYQKTALASAGFFLAFMIMNYFFSWGIAVSVLAALIVFLLFRKEYETAGVLAFILPLGAVFSSPYWYSMWRARESPWYAESALRSGLFYTHSPLFNKLLLATLALFALLLLFDFFVKKRERIVFRLEQWHWFCFALLFGSLWALNQQIVTGMTVWPFHFVQYSIPLAMIVALVSAHRILFCRFRFVRIALLAGIVGSSLAFGVYSQAYTYQSSYPYYREMQSYAPLLDWFDKQPQECVVLVNDETAYYVVNDLILAFTHCDVYVSTNVSLLMPDERMYHNMLVTVRLKGVLAGDIERYVKENESYFRVRLASTWQGIYQTPVFTDFHDYLLDERMKEFPEMYTEFMQKDFEAELRKYRLDFILSVGPLSEGVKKQLPHITLIKEIQGTFIYQF